MKVLMIAPQPFFQPRGTPFSVLHRLRALSLLGYEIDLVTYHLGQDVSIPGVKIHRAAAVPFVKRIAIGPSKAKIFLDVQVYRRCIELLKRGRYDLIHTHEEAGFFGIRLSKKFGTLHLYDMHSSLPQQLSNFKYSKSKLLVDVFENLEAKTIASAQAVITICPELHAYVHEKYPTKFNKLIENVGDNSDVFQHRPDLKEIKQRYSLNGETLVLYAGTLEPYQGIDLLIESSQPVLRKHAHVRFLVVGGNPQQVAEYKNMTERLGVREQFVFTGQRPPEEIPQFMQIANVLVSPRIKGNNTPLKIYSYLRSGIPIVATNHLTHTQVLKPEVAVLTDCTPASFAQGLLRVLENKNYGQTIAAQARALAEREYSYEAYLRKTKEVYSYLESLRA
ncbi:glycosyltransferase family 4 protein [candidate division KSB1 bacterium]|nr:glycosyltransferase family 4 protein [candidate division KSB1 bacterium]